MEQHDEQWPDDEAALPGYRFKPKPRELIHYYLNPWITNPAGQTPFGEREGVVCAADVYSCDPGTLTSQLRHFGHDDGNWYFLCVARWKDGNVGARMNRAVKGGGTWHGSGKRIAVPRHGYRQTFEYRDAAGGKSAWLMEEFGSALPEATGSDGVKVICRVHRTPRAAAAADDGDEERQEETTSAKRPRRAPSQDYWTTTAPPPPEASTSHSAPPETTAGGSGITCWQQPMMEMEQGLGCNQCTGVNGGLDFGDDLKPLETILAGDMVGLQELLEMDFGSDFFAENAQMNEWRHDTFPCPQPTGGAPQEDDDPKGKKIAS